MEGLLETLKTLIGRADLPTQALSCDTTFNLGLFYGTFMIFRIQREFLEIPIMPVFYMLHESITAENHEAFWQLINKHFPQLNKATNTFIDTDD